MGLFLFKFLNSSLGGKKAEYILEVCQKLERLSLEEVLAKETLKGFPAVEGDFQQKFGYLSQ